MEGIVALMSNASASGCSAHHQSRARFQGFFVVGVLAMLCVGGTGDKDRQPVGAQRSRPKTPARLHTSSFACYNVALSTLARPCPQRAPTPVLLPRSALYLPVPGGGSTSHACVRPVLAHTTG